MRCPISTRYLRSSRRCAGAASSAGDKSGKLGATASGDMTGSGNKPAKEFKNDTKIFGHGKHEPTNRCVHDDCSAALMENISEKAREAL